MTTAKLERFDMEMSDYLDDVEVGADIAKAKLGVIGKAFGWFMEEGFLILFTGVVIIITSPLWMLGKLSRWRKA